MKKTCTLLALVFCLHVKAQTWVTIPDAHFVTYLQNQLPAAMQGDSLNISSPLVTSTGTIIINNTSITDLTGIEYFASLTYLDCSYNSLTYLPVLPDSLILFYCFHNKLDSIPKLPTKLQSFSCSNNNLISIPALPNTLQYLSCQSNSLTALPALPNTVVDLYCGLNMLTSLPALPPTLRELDCSSNQIICFSFFPNSLTYIELGQNPFTCLPNHVAAMFQVDLATPLCASGNSNGCPAGTGINQFENNNRVSLYPNPTQSNFAIETTYTNKQTLQLFDVNGKLVLTQTIIGKTNIDASNLAEGVYNLSLISTSGVVNKRLVIVR